MLPFAVRWREREGALVRGSRCRDLAVHSEPRCNHVVRVYHEVHCLLSFVTNFWWFNYVYENTEEYTFFLDVVRLYCALVHFHFFKNFALAMFSFREVLNCCRFGMGICRAVCDPGWCTMICSSAPWSKQCAAWCSTQRPYSTYFC